ncbi:hypothetical protein ACWF94_13940 [Streptomyces sp. NPDC055078]
MMTLAGEWYSNSILWTIVGIGVTLGVGVLAAWAALKANNPKLRLGYRISSTTKLLANHASAGSGLAVTHNGVALTAPHVADVQLVNEGRRDIVSAMFHNGTPVELDLGEPILALLDSKSSLASVPPPAASTAGNKVVIAPAYLRRAQRVTYSVLLDGPVTDVSLVAQMVNVDVRKSSADSGATALTWMVGCVIALLMLLGALLASVLLPIEFIEGLKERIEK